MSYTYENKQDLIAEGDYEVIVDKIERKTLPSGKEKIGINFRIRSDVEGQKYGNRIVFEDIWQEKDHPEFFNRRRINQILGTQGIKEGTVFEDINDVIKVLEGSFLQIHIVAVFDDYRGTDVNKVSYYKSSNFKPQSMGGADTTIALTEDELPF